MSIQVHITFTLFLVSFKDLQENLASKLQPTQIPFSTQTSILYSNNFVKPFLLHAQTYSQVQLMKNNKAVHN